MLKQKLNKDDIVVFRTVGSDEVIATLIEETDTVYRVKKPLALAMTAKGVGMTQYMIMADRETEFEFLKTTLKNFKFFEQNLLQNRTTFLFGSLVSCFRKSSQIQTLLASMSNRRAFEPHFQGQSNERTLRVVAQFV